MLSSVGCTYCTVQRITADLNALEQTKLEGPCHASATVTSVKTSWGRRASRRRQRVHPCRWLASCCGLPPWLPWPSPLRRPSCGSAVLPQKRSNRQLKGGDENSERQNSERQKWRPASPNLWSRANCPTLPVAWTKALIVLSGNRVANASATRRTCETIARLPAMFAAGSRRPRRGRRPIRRAKIPMQTACRGPRRANARRTRAS